MTDRPDDRHLAAALDALLTRIGPGDPAAARAAAARHAQLTKPPGSLGRLEALGVQLAAVSGRVPPPVPGAPAVAVFAADHGVVAEGVTPWPREVTAQMVANFCGGGAAINVLARRVGARLVVVDVGVATPLPDHPSLVRRPVGPGTANLRREPAMSRSSARRAVLAGADTAAELIAGGADLLVGGDMGIGNTTPSAAVISALTGRSPAEVTGRGTGIDDAMLAHKTDVVADALARCGRSVRIDATAGSAHDTAGDPDDAVDVLAELGGFEIGALAGFFLQAAASRVPVIVDGVIALAGACLAARAEPAVLHHLIAGHRSTEPGATAALEWLGLEPLVDLGLRLGEGSGAALAIPLVQSAAAVLGEMATFADAGIVAGPG